MNDTTASLRDELEFLRSTMDELEAGVCQISLDGKLLWANRAYCELLGYSAEEILGLSVKDTSLPEELAPQLQAIEEMIAGRRETLSMDKRYRRRDSSIFWASFVTRLQRDKNGQPKSFLTIVQNINARKEAEFRLQESESRLAESQRIAHLGSWERDLRTNKMIFSDESYRILGFDPGTVELTVERAASLIHPDDHEARVRFEKTSNFENDVFQNLCRIIRHSDGAIRVVRAHAQIHYASDGAPCRMVGTIQDITELKESESSRERAESFLNLVLDSVPALVAYIDQDIRYRYCNQTYNEWFGYQPKDLIGKSVSEVVGPQVAEIVLPSLQRALRGETIDWEGQVPYRYGGAREVSATYVPDRGPDGLVRGVVILVMDVTSLKEGEKVIAQQRDRITQSERLAALGEMTGGIAHEINNPLSIIFARAEILKDHATHKSLDPEKVEIWADKLLDMAVRISKIVKSIRAISRNGDGDPFEHVSVSSIFDDMSELCTGRLKKEQITLHVELKSGDLLLECRPIQLQQVILNLLNNACHAVLQCEESWIRLEATDLGDNVEISVTDSGPGITPELEKKIFLPFFTTKPPGQGTGLGLSLSQNIVTSHNGALRLDRSTPNTRFVVILPKRQSFAFDANSNAV